MQGLLEVVNLHAKAVGIRINASKTKVMSAFIAGEQRQAVLLDDEPVEGSMFNANGQGTEENRNRITHAHFAFFRLQSCL